MVEAITRDEEFVGEKITWGEDSKEFPYQLAKRDDKGTVVCDAEGNPKFEAHKHTSRWKTYASGGTKIRHRVLEDAVLGRYGSLARPRVRVRNVAFDGKIDLSFQLGVPALEFRHCSFHGMALTQAQVAGVRAENCAIGSEGLNANLATIGGCLFLDECSMVGGLDFSGVEVRGQLSLKGTVCLESVRFVRLKVTADVFLDSGFEAHGPVMINGSTIGGQLACNGAKFLWQGDNCFRAEGLNVGQSVFLSDGFEAYGPVEINGSTIGGQLNCIGAKFLWKGDNCLMAQGLKVTADVFLSDGFEAHGPVMINSSTILGQLNCIGAKFLWKDDNCLRAFSLKVTADVFLKSGFEAHGSVDISGSTILGQLNGNGAKFLWTRDSCLRADGLDVKGYTLTDVSTVFSGNADLSYGTFGSAVDISGAAKSYILEDSTVSGTLSVRSSKIQNIDLTEATIGRFDDRVALESSCNEPGRCWAKAFFRDLTTRPNRESSQPKYKLAGVEIKSLDPSFLPQGEPRYRGLSVKDHELGNWIEAADEGNFHADVYETFAALLHKQGRVDQAKYLLIRKMRHLRKSHPWWKRGYEILLKDLPIAYGYRSGQVFVLLIAAWILSIGVVSLAHAKNAYSPVGSNRTVAIDLLKEQRKPKAAATVFQQVVLANPIPGFPSIKGSVSMPHQAEPPVVKNDELRAANGPGFVNFCPAMYALDHLVPIISFNQKANWDLDRTNSMAGWLVPCQWLATVFGWVLTTLFVSSFSGLIKSKN